MTNEEKNIVEYCEKKIKEYSIWLIEYAGWSGSDKVRKELISFSKAREDILKKYGLIN